MWRLSKLDIKGFKSFADGAQLLFPEGITAVVGPNGCGKSNISDAIVWALGEQSTNVLRAQRMNDVIFQGTASRRATGVAEVTLHLTGRTVVAAEVNGNGAGVGAVHGNGNGDGHHVTAAPGDAADEELSITRRLYRSGDSEYLLNGQKCLLRDVRERLMGTGLGARAAFTIGQGRIDQILSASPLERRAPIEEAAGISLYRRRRHITNLKLEATSQDLARVEDIVQEVARQMRSLKRQAGLAERYRELRERLSTLERRWFAISLRDTERATAIAAAAFEATSLAESESRARLETATGALERARGAWRERRQRQAQRRQGLYNAQVELERARGDTVRHGDRATFAQQRLRDLGSKLVPAGGGEPEGGSLESAQAGAAAALDVATAQEERAREALVAATAAWDEARSSWRQRRRQQDEARQQLYEARLQQERAGADAERNDDRKRAALRRIDELTRLEDELRERVVADTAVLASRRAAAVEAEESVRAAERLAHEAQDRLDPLQHLEPTDTASDHDAVLELAPLAAGLQVHEDFRAAVATVLGPRLRLPVIDASAERLWLQAVAGLPGASRALRLPGTPGAEAAPAAEVRGALADKVVATDAASRSIVADLLRSTWLVDDAETALRLARQHPGHAFVDVAGRAWARGAEVLLRPEAVEADVLDRTARQTTRVHRADVEGAQVVAQAAAGRAAARLEGERAEAALRAARAAAVAATREIDVAATALRQRESEARRTGAEREAQQTIVREAEVAKAGALKRGQELGARAGELEAAIAALGAEEPAREQEVSVLESAVGSTRQALDAARGQRAAAAARAEELQRLHREMESLQRLIEQSRAAAATAEETATGAALRCKQLEAQVGDSDSADAAEEAQIAGLEAAVSAARTELEAAQGARTGSEVRAAEARMARTHLHQQLRERLDTEPWQLLEGSGPEPGVDPGALHDEVMQVRSAIDRLGPVNLVAYEDFRQQEGRFNDLDGQRKDLSKATTNLKEAIRRIDEECVTRFAEAFAAIDGYFNRIFRQLFGGGRAGMRLETPEDPLNSGIEIMAQAPGKALQSIRLMSGGERSMIALALMFAVFEYHPAPFCILDEADAALDDRNVGRFVQALHQFQERAQFIMITHNKRSMEIADLLYGVTMEESGVSKLVSVQLN